MEGVIVNYRRGRHTQTTNQMIVQVPGVDSRAKAKPMVGKTVTWHSSGKVEIKGKVKAEHGNGGALKVHFEKGMPGQSIGQKVKIE